MIDLFGLEQQPKRIHDKPEAAALVEVLKALNTHSAVAWCERMNSGAARMGGRFVRFGFRGCPDVLGQLRDGRLLGVAAVVKLVVAFVLIIQAAFCVLFDSIFGAVVGFRCTSTMRFQLRVEPDQRFGLA